MAKDDLSLSITDMTKAVADGLKNLSRNPSLITYKPHAKQERFHKSQAKGRLYVGGNRSGKTVGGCIEAIYHMKGEHPYKKVPPVPTKGRIITVDFKKGEQEIIVPQLQQWIPPSLLKNGSWEDSYNNKYHKLTLANGSTAEIMSHEQELDAFAGTSRHWLWMDEECPKPIYKESQARLIDTDGDWWMTMTPIDGMCVDEHTRLLSKRGWLYYWQVLPSDIILTYNQELKKTQWLPIEAMYINEDFEGEVLVNQDKQKNKISFRTTVDHKWVTDKGLEPHPIFKDIIIAADHENISGLPYSNDFCNLIGWVVGDGTIPKDSNTKVVIYQNPGELSDVIENKLISIGATYSKMTYENRNRFQIRGDLGRQIRSVVGPKKSLSIEFISGLSQIQLESLARGLMLSDGTLRDSGTWEYTTVRKDHAEAYSIVGTLLGKRVTIRQYGTYFKVAFWGESRDRWGSDSKTLPYKAKDSFYKGVVWCPNTRNGTFVAERLGSIYITSNTWVYDELFIEYNGKDSNRVEVITVDMAENPHIPTESRLEFLLSLDEEDRKIRGKGAFVPLGGILLKEFHYDNNVIEYASPPLEWEWWVSIDHGLRNPTAVLWHAISPTGSVFTFHEHYRSEWLISQHANYIKKYNEKMRDPDRYIGDLAMNQRNAASGLSVQQIYRNYGINIALAKKGKGSVEAGIDKMNDYFRLGKWQIADTCVNLIKEIRKYRGKPYSSAKLADSNNKREAPQQKDDHAIDSSRYLFTFMPRLDKMVPKFDLPVAEANLAVAEIMGVSKTTNKARQRVYPWRIDPNLVPQPPAHYRQLEYGEIP